MKKSFFQFKNKKQRLYAQITLFIVVTAIFSGMLIGTEVYTDIKDGIVEVLCLSCLKLDPKTTRDFTFNTVNNEPHPDYVLDNLSSGIVFLHFSEDACPGCDIMLPIVQNLMSVEFEKTDLIASKVDYNDEQVTYFYTNIDHATPERIVPFKIYDIRHVSGLPMFTIVTLGYDSGVIKPKFVTLYGTLGLDTDEKRMQLLENVIDDSFTLWNENVPGYTP